MIFRPALLNAVAGLLTTIVNVYTVQKGVFSITARITGIVTGSSIFVSGFLFVVYSVLLDKVKAKHQREMDPSYRSGLEKMFSKAISEAKMGKS
jgi:high-affinity Fe2+/Pb2+ permease